VSIFDPLARRAARLAARLTRRRPDPSSAGAPPRPPADRSSNELEALAGDLVRDGTARLTDMETASRMFTALLACRAMFDHPTEAAASEARVAVEIALARAQGRGRATFPSEALGSGRRDNPLMDPANKVLDAMFEILARCHQGEFKHALDQEVLMEWTRSQLRQIGFDVVPLGSSHGQIRGLLPKDTGKPGAIELVEASRPD
jgi:hypothetical protein